MPRQLFLKVAKRLLRCPAVAYHEEMVRAEVERLCDENDLPLRHDATGNLFIRLARDARRRPLVLAAHMDHPGFEIIRQTGPRQFHARFLGGVPDPYFRRGTPVRLMPGGWRGKLGKRLPGEKRFVIHTSEPVCKPVQFAVWEVADYRLRGDRVVARACDDLVGVAAVLATLIALKKARAKVNVLGVISRAEEVGFHGALMIADAQAMPDKSLVISLEASRELPAARIGKGVIIRVGDRASVFNSAATRFLTEVAGGLQKRARAFAFQRALMGGGTCEASVYQEFGYQAAAVCVALGNYHNCGGRDKIAAEYVSATDATSLVQLLVAVARRMGAFRVLTGKLPKRLARYLTLARRGFRLRASRDLTPLQSSGASCRPRF